MEAGKAGLVKDDQNCACKSVTKPPSAMAASIILPGASPRAQLPLPPYLAAGIDELMHLHRALQDLDQPVSQLAGERLELGQESPETRVRLFRSFHIA